MLVALLPSVASQGYCMPNSTNGCLNGENTICVCIWWYIRLQLWVRDGISMWVNAGWYAAHLYDLGIWLLCSRNSFFEIHELLLLWRCPWLQNWLLWRLGQWCIKSIMLWLHFVCVSWRSCVAQSPNLWRAHRHTSTKHWHNLYHRHKYIWMPEYIWIWLQDDLSLLQLPSQLVNIWLLQWFAYIFTLLFRFLKYLIGMPYNLQQDSCCYDPSTEVYSVVTGDAHACSCTQYGCDPN